MEGAGGGGANRSERWDGGVGVGLVLLASGATFNVFADVGGEARPPEFCSDELTSFEIAWVTSTFMVVTPLENGVAEGIVIGDVDPTLIGQDACVNLPVREAGTEGERDVVVHGLEGLENEGITRRGGLDTVGEGHIDNVDEEGRGEEGDSVVVVVGVGKEVWATREGIWAGEEFSWDMDHFQVKVREIDEPAGLSSVEVLGGTEVGEVFVVGEDLDGEGGSMEVVSP